MRTEGTTRIHPIRRVLEYTFPSSYSIIRTSRNPKITTISMCIYKETAHTRYCTRDG